MDFDPTLFLSQNDRTNIGNEKDENAQPDCTGGAAPWQMPTLCARRHLGVNWQDFTSISFTICLTLGIVRR